MDGNSSIWRGFTLSNGRQTRLRNLFFGYENETDLHGEELRAAVQKEVMTSHIPKLSSIRKFTND